MKYISYISNTVRLETLLGNTYEFHFFLLLFSGSEFSKPPSAFLT